MTQDNKVYLYLAEREFQTQMLGEHAWTRVDEYILITISTNGQINVASLVHACSIIDLIIFYME